MLATDGLHPNAEAHEEWARTLAEKLILVPPMPAMPVISVP